MNKFLALYKGLLKTYGRQGWWPISGRYHKNDFSYPKNDKQRFEICVGAILTQNTAWKNVEKALKNLRKERLMDAQKILSADTRILSDAIMPAGYFNQKTRKLKIFSEFYLSLKGRTPSRKELLDNWGIGPETADSILLYAYKVPVFVVDAYTKKAMGMQDKSYDEVKELFEKNLSREFRIFQEYHALIVECAKQSRR